MVGLVVFADFGSIAEEIAHKLIPNWVSFVVQFAALCILVAVVFFVAYKPMKKMLKKRADYIENNIKQSEIDKSEAEKNNKQSQETIIASKKQASEIIAEAKVTASKIEQDKLEETNKEIQKMKQSAEEDIVRSQQEAMEEVRKEMVSVALDASKEILKREVNKEDNQRLVEDFIKDIK